MDTTLLVAIMAALVTAIGWIVTYRLAVRQAQEVQQIAAALRFTERQLEELYGPLYFFLVEGEQSYKNIEGLIDVARLRPPGDEQTLTIDQKIWLFWMENDALPRNEKIAELLRTRSHLIEGEQMPESFHRFLEHHSSWRLFFLMWQERHVDIALFSNTLWPREFDLEVHHMYSVLKRRHASFLREMRQSAHWRAIGSEPGQARSDPVYSVQRTAVNRTLLRSKMRDDLRSKDNS